MKKFLIGLNLVIWSFVGYQVTAHAQPAKQPSPEKIAAKETNCVTKDKKGNCPPAPKSEKPTPKKKAEKPAESAKK